jgi:hypothetical protein
MNGCQTVKGSIYIQNFTANEIINLSGLQRVHGDLIIDGNRGLTQIILVNLAQVDGELKLKDSLLLKRIDFPKLTSVRSLELSILPLLETVQFSQGLSEVVDAITITDTAIKAIEGLTVNKVGNVSIANNVNLTRIDLSHLEQIDGVISISANSPHTILDVRLLFSCTYFIKRVYKERFSLNSFLQSHHCFKATFDMLLPFSVSIVFRKQLAIYPLYLTSLPHFPYPM